MESVANGVSLAILAPEEGSGEPYSAGQMAQLEQRKPNYPPLPFPPSSPGARGRMMSSRLTVGPVSDVRGKAKCISAASGAMVYRLYNPAQDGWSGLC